MEEQRSLNLNLQNVINVLKFLMEQFLAAAVGREQPTCRDYFLSNVQPPPVPLRSLSDPVMYCSSSSVEHRFVRCNNRIFCCILYLLKYIYILELGGRWIFGSRFNKSTEVSLLFDEEEQKGTFYEPDLTAVVILLNPNWFLDTTSCFCVRTLCFISFLC